MTSLDKNFPKYTKGRNSNFQQLDISDGVLNSGKTMNTQFSIGYLFFSICVACVTGVNVKVAVYEHVVISPDDPEAAFTRQEAFEWMSKNLKVFEEQTRMAAEKGAKIVVFPEYGITGFDHSRNSIIPFLEDIPNVNVNWNPCEHPSRFQDTFVLRNLSCMAKEFRIYLVANMGDIKTCDSKEDRTCPPDGRYQFNTNVVFDSNGTFIARYHKRNMFDETPLFDPAPNNEYVFFETPFGKFGTVVCFDIIQHYPTQVLLAKYGIKNLLVTSAWNAFFPFILPVQMYSGLAKKHHINVIASNIRNELYHMAGSGIFGDTVAVSSNVNYTSKEGVLLIAEIETDVSDSETATEIVAIGDVDEIKPLVNKSYMGIYNFGMEMEYSILQGQSGFIATCQKSVCCAVKYTFKYYDESERIILSAVDHELTVPGIIHMQYCAVFKCNPGANQSCDISDIAVTSVFSEIKIQAYTDKGVTFPFVSTVSGDEFGDVNLDFEMENYDFNDKKLLLYSNQFQNPLLAAVVFNTVGIEEPNSGESSKAATNAALSCIVLTLTIGFFIIEQLPRDSV